MAIFSRRTLQRLLNENSIFLKPDQIARHVNMLNNASEEVLDTEWEVAVLNAFSRMGGVTHEPDLNGKKPDIWFEFPDSHEGMIIDITTVSDRGLHKENPFDALRDELQKKVWKLRSRGVTGAFSIQVGASPESMHRDGQPTKLRLPKSSRF